jgi:putative transposase
LELLAFNTKSKDVPTENVPIESRPRKIYKRTSILTAASKIRPELSPWYDVVGNDTEAMVVSLYAKGLTTRDIVNYLKSVHSIDMAQPSVSAITDKVFPLVKEWQSRPLSSCYPVIYLDGLHFKVREAGKISSKVAYIALGVNQYGQKEVMGIWISQSEGAKFWAQVLNDIKNRGVEDILITCVDGLKGFPEAITAIFPKTEVQVCITHQIRHTIKFVPHRDKEKFCDELKLVYTAPSDEAGMQALQEMMERWPQYRSYLKSWETRWADLSPFFNYSQPIRRMIYTTNAIENLNRQFRKVTKTTTVFPHDDALLKLLWLAQADISQGWTLPVRNWGEIMAQISVMFPDRVQF